VQCAPAKHSAEARKNFAAENKLCMLPGSRACLQITAILLLPFAVN
jgi:hypothetical protein